MIVFTKANHVVVKGGLVIYLQKRFDYKIRKIINTSNIWEGVFIDFKNGGLKKTLTLGNKYRPLLNKILTQIMNVLMKLLLKSCINCRKEIMSVLLLGILISTF